MIYAGIGSRSTPQSVLVSMHGIAVELARKHNMTLRSGGADGADKAFEAGCNRAGGTKEIYLPWAGFNHHPGGRGVYDGPTHDAYDMAAEFHPAWQNCSRGAMAMHARNCHQVLGWDLRTPASFIICWTPGARLQGGTAQALRIAQAHHIPIYNLASRDSAQQLHELLFT